MNIRVTREPSRDDTTLGSLFIDDHWQCHTLEDVIRPAGEKVRNKTAIPPGRYKLILSMSNRFKKVMPEVLAVPMFTGIRIHAGNTAKDTAGCLLVGQTRSVEARSIGRSRLAYNALMSKLTAAVEAGDTIHITCVNPKRCRRRPTGRVMDHIAKRRREDPKLDAQVAEELAAIILNTTRSNNRKKKMKSRIAAFAITILCFATIAVAQPRFPIIAPHAGLLNLQDILGSDADDEAAKGPSEREFLCGDLRAFAESQDSLATERDRGLAYSDFWGNWGVSDSRVYTMLDIDPTNGKFSFKDNAGEKHELGLWARKESRDLWARCLTHRDDAS